MNWDAGPVTIRRRGRNHSNVSLDPITKTFIQQDPPEKQVKVELTIADKERVIEDFKEVMGRLPDEAEKESLFIEERKIKRGNWLILRKE